MKGTPTQDTILKALNHRSFGTGFVCYVYDDEDNLIRAVDCSHLKIYTLISKTELAQKIKEHINEDI